MTNTIADNPTDMTAPPSKEIESISKLLGDPTYVDDHAVQERSLWCWAACCTVILNSVGYTNVTQQQIVNDILGDPNFDKTLSMSAVKNRLLVNTHTGSAILNSSITPTKLPPKDTIDELNSGNPIVAITKFNEGHHATIVYGYSIDNNILNLKVFDPFPGRGKEQLAYSDFPWDYTVVVKIPGKSLSQQVDDAALDNIEDHSYDDTDDRNKPIHWHLASDGHNADYDFIYKNIHGSKAINVTVTVMLGEVDVQSSSSASLKDRNWVPTGSKDFALVIGPGETKHVIGSSNWETCEGKMPRLECNVTKCSFVDGQSEPPNSTSSVSVSSFRSFAGLSIGDSVDEVKSIYGYVWKIDDDSGTDSHGFVNYNCHGRGPDITTESDGKIYTVEINGEDEITAIRKKGIAEPNLDLFGKTDKAIQSILGKPDSDDGQGDLTYSADRPDGSSVQVDFYCYDFKQYKCDRIVVSWFPKKEK